MKKLFYWTPRILGLLFAGFLGLFAIDSFSEANSLLEKILAFLINLTPAFVVLLATILAWRWEWIGAVVFGFLGAFYIYYAWERFPLLTYISICGPLFLISLLFLAGWIRRKQKELKG